MIVFANSSSPASRRSCPERIVGDPPPAFAWLFVVYLMGMLALILA